MTTLKAALWIVAFLVPGWVLLAGLGWLIFMAVTQ